MRTRTLVAILALALLLPACFPKAFKFDPFALVKFALGLQTGLSLQEIAPFVVDIEDVLFDRLEALEGGAPEGAPVKGQAVDEAVGFVADGNDGFAVLGLKRELRHPFRVEVTTGVFDPAAIPFLGGGFSALELDVWESDPLLFISGGAQPIVDEGGAVSAMNVFVATEAGNQGQLLIPGASKVDLAMESHDDDVDVFARATGTPEWQLVASVPRPAPDAVWYPFVGALGLDEGGSLGADDLFLVANGASTAQPGTVEAAIEDAWNGFAGLLHARNHMDGVPDPDAALPELELAVPALESARDTAIALLEAAAAGKPLKPAKKQLIRAAKQGAQALLRLQAGKTPKSVVKAIAKAELSTTKALAALRAEALVAD